MAKINYVIIGDSNFLKSMEYMTYLPSLMNEFEFILAEDVLIHFEESLNPNPNNPVFNDLFVSNEGKSIHLIYKTSRHRQPNGELRKPSVENFISGLRYYMENTVIAGDNERFKQLDNNNGEIE